MPTKSRYNFTGAPGRLSSCGAVSDSNRRFSSGSQASTACRKRIVFSVLKPLTCRPDRGEEYASEISVRNENLAKSRIECLQFRAPSMATKSAPRGQARLQMDSHRGDAYGAVV